MCIADNEPGGPKRCSYHERQKMGAAQGRLDAALAEQRVLQKRWDELNAEQSRFYDEAGIAADDMFARILGPDESAMTAEQQARTHDLAERFDHLGTQMTSNDATVDRRREAFAAARDDYYATPEGIGVLAATIDHKHLAYNNATTDRDKQAAKFEVGAQMRALIDTEQRMINQQAERDRRWNLRTHRPVRGARLGLRGNDVTSQFVAGAGVTGSYTDTVRPNPDAQISPTSPPEDDAWLVTSRMELTRVTPDGKRVKMVVAVERPAETAADPTVAGALSRAVHVANDYHPDYTTWANRHWYDTDPKAPWSGSRSYSEGRAAHDQAADLHARVRQFLTTDELRRFTSGTEQTEAVS